MSAAGIINVPSTPGDVVVSGLDFDPGSIMFLCPNMAGPGTRTTTTAGEACGFSTGFAGYDTSGVLTNFALFWANHGGTAQSGRATGASAFQNKCVKTRDNTSTANPVTASVTSYGNGSFTLNFTEVVAGRKVYYLAFPDVPTVKTVRWNGPDTVYDLDDTTGRAGIIAWRGDSPTFPIDTWFGQSILGAMHLFSAGDNPYFTPSNEYGGLSEGSSTNAWDRWVGTPTGAGDLITAIYYYGLIGTVYGGWSEGINHGTHPWGWTLSLSGGEVGFGGGILFAADDHLSTYDGWSAPTSGSVDYSFIAAKSALEGDCAIVLSHVTPVGGNFAIGMGIAHPDLQVVCANSKRFADSTAAQIVAEDASWISGYDIDTPETNSRGTATFPNIGQIRLTQVGDGSQSSSGVAPLVIGPIEPLFTPNFFRIR